MRLLLFDQTVNSDNCFSQILVEAFFFVSNVAGVKEKVLCYLYIMSVIKTSKSMLEVLENDLNLI